MPPKFFVSLILTLFYFSSQAKIHYTLKVDVDPSSSFIKVQSNMQLSSKTLQDKKPLHFVLHKGLKLENHKLVKEISIKDIPTHLKAYQIKSIPKDGILSLNYAGKIISKDKSFDPNYGIIQT